MLLYNRLNFEEKKVLEQVWGDNKRKDKNEGELTAYTLPAVAMTSLSLLGPLVVPT